MSGSITFRCGPFQGWNLSLYSDWTDGRLARILVQFSTPYRAGGQQRSGLLQFSPGVEGFSVAEAAEYPGGPVLMAELLDWVIEANWAALGRRTDIPAEQRAHWEAIVDEADQSRADFFAYYLDGAVPGFEIVGGNLAGHQLVAV